MRFLILAASLTVSPAFAQFNGLGLTPGQQCPYNYGPGAGAVSPRDPLSNINGQMRSKQESLARLDGYLKGDIDKIRQVIKSPEAWDFIDRHYKTKGGRDSYQPNCIQEKRRSGSGSGQRVAIRQRGRRASQVRSSGLIPVPSEFCTFDDEKSKYLNDWDEVVAEDGKVMDEICNYEVPASGRPVERARSARCARGLTSYYERMAKREALEREIEDLKEQQQLAQEAAEKRNEEMIERQRQMQDRQLEAQYCPWCGGNNWAQQGSAGVMPALNNNFNMMLNFNQRQFLQGGRMPPPQMPWQRPGIIRPGQPTFPGPGRYPALPYAAQTRGYNGIQPGFAPDQGFYGGVPGAVGAGAFGCQGTDPYGFGNPNAPQFMPFQNATANPWMNPYRQNPGQFNPAFNNGLFNRGYGPGFGPQLGNGTFAPQYQPWNSPYAGNPLAPFGNSFAGGGYQPWYNTPGTTYGLGVNFPPIVNGGQMFGAPPIASPLGYQMGVMQNQFSGAYGLYAPEIIRPPLGGGVQPQPFPAPLPNRPPNPVPGAGGGAGAPAVVRPGP